MIKVQNGVASREPIPWELANLDPDDLANLQTRVNPVPEQFIGMEWWPEVADIPTFDPATHEVGGELLVVDAGARVVRVTQEVVAIPAERLAQQQASAAAALLLRIDAEADAIYARVLGNRATEYAQAEAEAGAYRDAGYAGDVPETVAGWAAIKSETPQWAADDILATAAAWRAAQLAIRSNRLARKEDARAAADQVALAAAAAGWEQFRSAVSAQLGL